MFAVPCVDCSVRGRDWDQAGERLGVGVGVWLGQSGLPQELWKAGEACPKLPPHPTMCWLLLRPLYMLPLRTPLSVSGASLSSLSCPCPGSVRSRSKMGRDGRPSPSNACGELFRRPHGWSRLGLSCGSRLGPGCFTHGGAQPLCCNALQPARHDSISLSWFASPTLCSDLQIDCL